MRWLGVLLGLGLAAVGVLGLAAFHVFETPLQADEGLRGLANLVGRLPSLDADFALAVLKGPVLAHVLPILGLALVLSSLWPEPDHAEPGSRKVSPERRLARRVARQAASLARKGQLQEAAELCVQAGLQDSAVEYFSSAREFVRAAEVRHDQNRFQESAELYVKGGHFESAGTIFASQSQFKRAAECYERGGRMSVAGEMYERAQDPGHAGDCFRRAGFDRQAAECYVQSQRWGHAASALERVLEDESPSVVSGESEREDRRQLVLRAAQLYEEAGELDAAQRVLERGDCHGPAAELAMRRAQFEKAAELFLRTDDGPRAAEALRRMGQDTEAARVLGEYHRDRGDDEEAAGHLEAAGEFLDAGDAYRKLEDYPKAGECYERYGDRAQAADMFRLAGDELRAAVNFERAGRHIDAAECYALAGDVVKEAEALARAGRLLRAGERFHREGLDDEAIKVLQQIQPGAGDFAAASALLGSIFRGRGLHSLAIKKLTQAVGDAELGRENLDAFYTLATVYEANGNLGPAVELYEKILTFDYHHQDVEERLARMRKQLGDSLAASAVSGPTEGVTGSRPGRYEVIGELGRGGMGIVYKARDTVLDRVVAYKVLPDALKESPQALRNFLREAQSAAQLNHPNIVTVYDAGEQDGRYYIAMEHVDGTTLKEILRRRKVIAPNGLVHLLTQMCEALAYAHDKKIVHRDIKTANAMWTRERKAKIMDFGLAKVVEEVRNLTTLVSGTPYYMSPEQTLGRNVDHRTDIYSLGVTFFELATGSLPFREGNVPYHHVHTPPPDPREIHPELPQALATIIGRCLQKDPAERYQSAREILDELRQRLSRAEPGGLV
jgi:tetratricopeptide (TPR) repeat protein